MIRIDFLDCILGHIKEYDKNLSFKFHFSLISLAASKKKVSGSCTHNFDAKDLPNS